jgi:hypothetical protein
VTGAAAVVLWDGATELPIRAPGCAANFVNAIDGYVTNSKNFYNSVDVLPGSSYPSAD